MVTVKRDCAGAQAVQFLPDTGTKAILGALAIYPIRNGLGALQYRGAIGRTPGAVVRYEGHKKTGTMNVLSLSRFRYLARIGKVSGLEVVINLLFVSQPI